MTKATTAERLRQLMDERNLKQADIIAKCDPLCKKYDVKITRSGLSQYISGKVQPGQDKLAILAQALNVDAAWLMGYDVPIEGAANALNRMAAEAQQAKQKLALMGWKDTAEPDLLQFDNIFPIETKKFPLLGEIACGEPVFAEQNFETFVEAAANINADFCLRAKGDSMIGARIFDGDIVFIHRQPQVENGQIAAVIIDDEATLKRVTYFPEKDMLILKPENPQYQDLIYAGTELNQVRILGRAVAFQSLVR